MPEIKVCSEKITTLIDEDDLEKVIKYSWNLNSSGYLRRTKLIQTNPRKYKTIFLHRFIMNITDPNILIDHINRNKFDNRKSNLRICNHRQNLKNRKVSKKQQNSVYKGIELDKKLKRRPWFSRPYLNGKRVNLGAFKTDIDAAKAYDLIHIYLKCEFIKTNFPKEDYKDVDIVEFFRTKSTKNLSIILKEIC